VESLEQCAARVRQHGGMVAVERQAIPGAGYQMYCRHTEGHLLGEHQADPNAKP